MHKNKIIRVKPILDRYAYEVRQSTYGGVDGYAITDAHHHTANGVGIIAICHDREQAKKIVDALNQYEEAENG